MTTRASSSLTYCVLLRHTDSEVVEKLTTRLDLEAIPFLLEHPDVNTLEFRVLVPEGQVAGCIAKLHEQSELVTDLTSSIHKPHTPDNNP